MSGAAPFSDLGPDVVLDAVEGFGIECDGRMIALNSYENRVYQIGVENGPPVVAKFYRPARWSDAQILEEHAFAAELGTAELEVATPIADADGSTLRAHAGHRVAVFRHCAGDWPELDREGRLAWFGRFLGRLHAVARAGRFETRPALSIESFGFEPSHYVRDCVLLPAEERARYVETTEALVEAVQARFDAIAPRSQRLHGDCHPGNVLWGPQGPTLVDLDDCRSGPAVQDFWMLVSGEPWEQRAQLETLLEGYETFAPFDRSELALTESLRALRLIHYAAWLARRWQDPAFPRAFPWFGSPGYWRGHIDDLAAQHARLVEG